MEITSVFQRQEYKYIMTKSQKAKIIKAINEHGVILDSYGRTTVRNVYYDTDSYRLIRHSIESPVYKEKLRLRSYEPARDDSAVFVELKKKYDHIVYKRRIPLKTSVAESWLSGESPRPDDRQITKEIDYFLSFYKTLKPVIFLSYEREAYSSANDNDLRITFDENILSRQKDLSLKVDVYGDYVLPPEMTLMEIKCGGSMPKWLATELSKNRLYKTSFSKYGTAYTNVIFKKQRKVVHYA